jgi:type III restriction enzyme
VTNRRIDNPILNSPFAEPTRHFAFDADGITDEVVEGRRPSTHLTPIPPVRRARKAQAELEFADEVTERVVENDFVNKVRGQVDLWRRRGYPNTTATSRRLLEHWTDPGREKRFFFCQIEAVETAIYLAEAAHKDTGGAFFQEALRDVSTEHNPGLYRVATKMATGTGKTVVMAMLIAWQTLNKAANPQDGRYTDAFLVVCPGITIRDRLRVLIPAEADNYYDERDVVPPELRSRLSRATVVITNFHSFLAREKVKAAATTKRILTRGRPDEAGVFTETPDQMVLRVCREFRSKRSIVILNDEAHHCYRPRAAPAEVVGRNAAGHTLSADEKAEAKANEAQARVWADGLMAVNTKLGIKTVYDLSATPFFLAGSGYREGTLFPWVVSDFGLVDAIEAGLVKVPRVPVEDNAARAAADDVTPTYRNLWVRVRNDLPKRKAANQLAEPVDPQLPPALEGALWSLYRDYEARYRQWEQSGSTPTPPVFIVVCNNTTVSKLVFDWVAGWVKPVPTATDPEATLPIKGSLELFSNVVDDRLVDRPNTVLVDSAELESGRALSPEFKAAAATEIAELKADIARRHGAGAAEDLDDATIVREAMNTVGQLGRLGEAIRCVVSVSMLTEGWDANTVTHILGVRAFGTQLLAEQVVGRGLRRRSYAVEDTPEGERFALEYAEIYGIPFSFIPAGGSGAEPPAPKPTTRVWAPP